MLKLINITKVYEVGDERVTALDSVSINFRRNEFVSVLGQSGCGKTTLLNIIGGLDGYTDGDLVIGGRSTKSYRDRDWDSYRNHSVGFVFQSYNLIPHQSVLRNVELALTLSGVSRAERRRRAVEALEKVGLGDQLNKRPAQMSGGQMQRVAIARALVNNPEILLADEPTGALDSATSVQIMDLLAEIARDRLVIMVTHNPELAERYSTRIVRLLDGRVTDDSNPYEGEPQPEVAPQAEKKRCVRGRSMSMLTALSLSFNNLMTKKLRTFLTSFAGSIGIIGIALIISLSSGIKAYINQLQRETLASYPITLQSESVDLTAVMSTMMGNAGDNSHKLDAVYSSPILYDMVNAMSSSGVTSNNLEKFKAYIDSNNDWQTLAAATHYSYNLNMNIYTRDADGKIISSDIDRLMSMMYGDSMAGSAYMGGGQSSAAAMTYNVWQELLPERDGGAISNMLREQYDVIHGRWPTAYNEIVLVVNERNELGDMALYALGLRTEEEMQKIIDAALAGKEVAQSGKQSWSYDEILSMSFRLLTAADYYEKQSDGTYVNLTETDAGMDYLYQNDRLGVTLKVTGIIRPSEDASATMLSGAIGYTSLLTDYLIGQSEQKGLITDQLASEQTDIITGKPFESTEELSDAEKMARFEHYADSLSDVERAELYISLMSQPDEQYVSDQVSATLQQFDRTTLTEMMVEAYAQQMGSTGGGEAISDYLNSMDDQTFNGYAVDMLSEQIRSQYAAAMAGSFKGMTDSEVIAMFDAAKHTDGQLVGYYELCRESILAPISYDTRLTELGYVDRAKPSAINIYADSFDNKDKLADMIADYNSSAAEQDKISYTDYVALMMSFATTMINAISYSLMAFVGISLVVSSIMIGIITYISVLERTKEIGILRAIGASKRDVSRVFNAETAIVGFTSGMIGIGATVLLNIPINIIIHALTGVGSLNAALPPLGGVILVVLSMALTLIAGFVPAKIAARRDPVVALRSE